MKNSFFTTTILTMVTHVAANRGIIKAKKN
jgi:hypothetical protein